VPRRVVFVTYPRITALDLVGPHEVFTAAAEVARRTGVEHDAYAVSIAAAEAGPVRTSRGPAIVADRSLSSLRGAIDTLVVVGGEGAHDAVHDARLVDWIRRTAPRCRRIASVCTGSFLLAAAGVLDGRRATTHWASCDRLASQFPRVRVESDPIFVEDGDVWTSAGVTAGMDLALALVEADLGREVALVTRATLCCSSSVRAGRPSSVRSSARSSPNAIRCASCSARSRSIPTATTASSCSRSASR